MNKNLRKWWQNISVHYGLGQGGANLLTKLKCLTFFYHNTNFDLYKEQGTRHKITKKKSTIWHQKTHRIIHQIALPGWFPGGPDLHLLLFKHPKQLFSSFLEHLDKKKKNTTKWIYEAFRRRSYLGPVRAKAARSQATSATAYLISTCNGSQLHTHPVPVSSHTFCHPVSLCQPLSFQLPLAKSVAYAAFHIERASWYC